jgi:hypothetical protein
MLEHTKRLWKNMAYHGVGEDYDLESLLEQLNLIQEKY